MIRIKRTTVLALAIASSACASHPHDGPTATALTATQATAAGPSAEGLDEAGMVDPVETLVLGQGLHTAELTEVVLDGRGRVALTLDRMGGVRLWPDLAAATMPEPVTLPVTEPVWMSVAQAKHGFVAAFIDTAGGTQVGRVSMQASGAVWTALFERPATDPLFEVHVLDGGTRILALGVDHRIHLWNAAGEAIAELDEVGFVPWQLRVSQPEGAAPHLLAVLAGPVRVQPLTLRDDKLTITGEARTVALDRGPNRNDLTMSPDGTTVAALRRPKARGKRFELEVIDMATGERKIVAAQSDVRQRPRVHPIDAHRVLMETGSGQGFYLDASAGMPWPPAQGEPDRETIANTALTMFTLPASTETSRVHSTVVHGVRVVPLDDALIVDPIEDTADATKRRREHRVLGKASFSATAIALDAKGDHVAWGVPDALLIESVGATVAPHVLPGTESAPVLLAFVGNEQVVAMDDAGRVSLRRVADGQTVASDRVPFQWGIATSAWRPADTGAAGQVVLASIAPSDPLHILAVAESGIGAAAEVARAQQPAWPEAGKPRGRGSRQWIEEIGLSWDALGIRPTEVKHTEPDPSGKFIAIVQEIDDEAFDARVITMFDREQGQRLWTRQAPRVVDMAWSHDGGRFGYTHGSAGFVLDARTGAVVHERHDLGLSVTQAAD